MNSFLSLLGQGGDLLLVILGFSSIIVIHELGHFLAARWAGIRVLAFAVGFGPALVSFRRGMGWRQGSSEPEFKKLSGDDGTGRLSSAPAASGVSPTEYRLNLLPFGGYVKMLGQDDVNPAARSSEPDSYQNCPPWKRMIVISAGVVANMITAAILFVIVFMVGLRTEPAKVGRVDPGSPAATTMAVNAAALGVTDPGLKSGDEIVSLNGEAPLSFNDVVLASAMARRNTPVHITVRREGVGTLEFSITPLEDPQTRMLTLGILPAASSQLATFRNPGERDHFGQFLADRGLPNVEAGMTMLSVDGRPAKSAYDLVEAAQTARGSAIRAEFRTENGQVRTIDIPTRPRMMRDKFMVEAKDYREARHLLGLMPVLAVEEVAPGEGGAKAGLKSGDVFARLGGVEWPSVPSGIAEVRANRGGAVRVVVMRRDDAGRWTEVDLGDVSVSRKGTIGFVLGDSSSLGPWVGTAYAKTSHDFTPPRLAPGSRIIAVGSTPTPTLLEVRDAMRRALDTSAPADPAAAPPGGDRAVSLTVEPPLITADGAVEPTTIQWTLSPAAARALATTAWEPLLDPGMFQPEQIVLKADGPVGAIAMGLKETHRVMMTTYITFARLFQGTVKVEHLKGPVGIAHVGTILADRGFIWLLFFMALISVNLAVINFLPIPIADGGHFVFLLYEHFTGKPVSAAVQNGAALAGLILLATVFLIVTFNDISTLVRGFL